MSGKGRKRKIDVECHVFNVILLLDYLFIYSGNKKQYV